MVKAQVPVAGRGKAGGILFASSVEDAEKAAKILLDTKIKGVSVRSVWIEEKVETKRELYFGITIDRFKQSYIALASGEGGVNIEKWLKSHHGKS